MVIFDVGVTMGMVNWELAILRQLTRPTKWAPIYKSPTLEILLNPQPWDPDPPVPFEKMVKYAVGVTMGMANWATGTPFSVAMGPMKWVTTCPIPTCG